jgi:hypothetical protein
MEGGGGGIIEVDQLPEVGEVGNVYRCKGKLYLYSNAFSDIIVNMDGQAGSLKEAFFLLGLNTQFNTEETTPTEIPMPPEDVLELYYIKDVDTIYINGDGVLGSFDEALGGAYGEYLGAIADISEATTVGYYALLKPWVEYTNVEGAIDVEENGEYDVSEIATAYVNVPNGVVYGKRRFIDYPNFYRHYIDQVVNFTTIRDGKVAKCSAMGAGPSGTFSEDRIHYTFDDNGSTSVFSLGWYDEESRLIDFGDTPQLVSKEFADFIETSTVKESEQLFEVSTEAEMTALLSTAEVGAIYKYTGETTDTYENGALYVVEESE